MKSGFSETKCLNCITCMIFGLFFSMTRLSALKKYKKGRKCVGFASTQRVIVLFILSLSVGYLALEPWCWKGAAKWVDFGELWLAQKGSEDSGGHHFSSYANSPLGVGPFPLGAGSFFETRPKLSTAAQFHGQIYTSLVRASIRLNETFLYRTTFPHYQCK